MENHYSGISLKKNINTIINSSEYIDLRKFLAEVRIGVIILFCLFRLSISSSAETHRVCHDCRYKTLNAAVDAAAPGDTIRVTKGRFASNNLTITKSVTLLGEPGAILDGENGSYVLRLLADSITISGFSIINSGLSYTKDYAAIYAHKTSGVKILNNEISKSFFGILLEKSANGQISRVPHQDRKV